MTGLAMLGFTLAGILLILSSASALDDDRAPQAKPQASDAIGSALLFALCLASVVHAHVKRKREEEEED